jgi:methylisocitrate lyase
MARMATAAGFPALYLGGGTLGYVKTVLEANLNLTEMTQLGIEIRAAADTVLSKNSSGKKIVRNPPEESLHRGTLINDSI